MSVIQLDNNNEAPKAGLPKNKKMIYIGLIVVLNIATFYFVYISFFSTPSAPAPSDEVGSFSGGDSPALSSPEAFQRFVNQLTQDLTILNDPKYKLLRSLGIKIPVVDSGRENPFVPY